MGRRQPPETYPKYRDRDRGGRQAPAPLAAAMGTTAARPLSSGTRPRAVDNGCFYVNNSKNN